MTDQSDRDDTKDTKDSKDTEQEMEREEHLDAETIAEDAEELFSKKAPDGSGKLLQPDAPPPET
jgi:hypothetical protein